MPAPAPSPPPALPPGTLLHDRYLIQGYIGGGGFGHIYKALDTALGYRRAIKEAFYQDSMTRHQFHLEAEFLLNTRHPNLVCGYAVFEQGGRLYLVMDYVDGNTLEEVAIDYIRRTGRPLPEYYVLDSVIPICGALSALHSAPVPVIHRDVKPANIKITRQGMPILIDLGLAKLYANGTQTIAPALAFTPGYAPPEQYRATGATDARTDIYGLGASLFYLLTGYQPTEAPARLGALEAPPLRQLRPDLSAATEVAVLRAMELDPARRQQSANEFGAELKAARAAIETSGFLWNADATSSPAIAACPRCGVANPPAARFCMRCGAAVAPLASLALVPSGAPGALDAASLAAASAQPFDAVRDPDTVNVADVPTVQAAPGTPADLSASPSDSDHTSAGRIDATRPGGSPGISMAEMPSPFDAPAEPPPAVAAIGSGAASAAAAAPAASGPMAPAAATRGAPASSVPNPVAPMAAADADARWGQVSPWPQEQEPDQPVMVLPVLHRGPAPGAIPLAAATPRRHTASDAGQGRPQAHPPARPNSERHNERPSPWLGASASTPSSTRGNQPRPPRMSLPPVPVPARRRADTVIAPLRQAAAYARTGTLDLALPSIARWHAETIAAPSPLDDREARAGIAAVMAVMFTVASALAVRYWWALALVLPGLFLAHWCRRAKVAAPAAEARWLATVALVVGYAWLALFAAGFLLLAVWGR